MTDLIVSFSGGRTSGFMSKWVKDTLSHIFNIHYVYANTGQEHENTLKFVNECDINFGLNLVWVEAKVIPGKGNGTEHSIVTYETASRKGEPFEDVIAKYGLPNKNYPHCTRELKINPMQSWAKSVGLGDAHWALGIRYDEPGRLKKIKRNILYPLVHLLPLSKEDILNWWSNQSFDLDIPEHLGNCTWCWKKSDTKVFTLARDHPGIFEFPLRMEMEYGDVRAPKETGPRRRMFRQQRNTVDILQMAQGDFKEFIDPNYDTDECAEECGSIIPEDWEQE